jgi:glucosamine--fructose-6-phosphate aminotransferase (isomerizing)
MQMCGIVAYLGQKAAQPILIEGLKRLEYRGYDSAGIAVNGSSGVSCMKAVGRIAELEAILNGVCLEGTTGIAHTRWATHGAPLEKNAHPHVDCAGSVAVIHNGIIENFKDLKEGLQQEGHGFRSETDTEVIAHLVEKYYQGDLEKAVLQALQHLQGTFGLAVIHADADRKS